MLQDWIRNGSIWAKAYRASLYGMTATKMLFDMLRYQILLSTSACLRRWEILKQSLVTTKASESFRLLQFATLRMVLTHFNGFVILLLWYFAINFVLHVQLVVSLTNLLQVPNYRSYKKIKTFKILNKKKSLNLFAFRFNFQNVSSLIYLLLRTAIVLLNIDGRFIASRFLRG